MSANTRAHTLPPLRSLLPALLVAAALWQLGSIVDTDGSGVELTLSIWFGAFFGVALQRSRFCFYCVSRDFIETRDARGPLGIVAALALGTIGYHVVFGAFIPQPAAPGLPPGAHIGPVSWVLAVGAFCFGIGMALAGSCISALLYRFGEGALVAPVALAGSAVGFVLGFLSWNSLYLGVLQAAPVVWLPHHVGYAGSLLLQLFLLAAVALLLVWRHRPSLSAPSDTPWWQRRWPAYVGGLLIAALGSIAYLRVAPLGVTAELGSLARTAADAGGILPARLEGLDVMRGCATAIKQTLWSNNSMFVIGLVAGSFAAACFAGDFRLHLPRASESLRAFVGGMLMGWGAMVALGCTVGTLLSGIMAAALSGWVFALFCTAGLYGGWLLRQRWPS